MKKLSSSIFDWRALLWTGPPQANAIKSATPEPDTSASASAHRPIVRDTLCSAQALSSRSDPPVEGGVNRAWLTDPLGPPRKISTVRQDGDSHSFDALPMLQSPSAKSQKTCDKELSVAHKLKSISVFCGSRSGNNAIFMTAARELGEALATHQITTVYGGAWVGTMGALADSALAHGGHVVGVMPKTIQIEGLAHRALTRLIVTSSVSERLAVMADESDGCIVLPGGLGTLHEFFEVYTSAFLGDYQKPIGLLNVQNFYGPLLAFIDGLVEKGFLSSAHQKTLLVSDNIEALLDAMRNFRYSTKNKLSDHEGKVLSG